MPTPRKPINDVLAENLNALIERPGQTRKEAQMALAKRSGVSQRSISNYLDPTHRGERSKSGKPRSAKLAEVEQIATSFDMEVWQLLRPMNPKLREFYKQMDAAVKALLEVHDDPPNEDRLPPRRASGKR